MIKKIIQLFLGEPEGLVSECDQFMAAQNFKLSASQQAEIAKHQAIADKRD